MQTSSLIYKFSSPSPKVYTPMLFFKLLFQFPGLVVTLDKCMLSFQLIHDLLLDCGWINLKLQKYTESGDINQVVLTDVISSGFHLLKEIIE